MWNERPRRLDVFVEYLPFLLLHLAKLHLTDEVARAMHSDGELIILDRVLPVFLRLHHRLSSDALEDTLVT